MRRDPSIIRCRAPETTRNPGGPGEETPPVGFAAGVLTGVVRTGESPRGHAESATLLPDPEEIAARRAGRTGTRPFGRGPRGTAGGHPCVPSETPRRPARRRPQCRRSPPHHPGDPPSGLCTPDVFFGSPGRSPGQETSIPFSEANSRCAPSGVQTVTDTSSMSWMTSGSIPIRWPRRASCSGTISPCLTFQVTARL